jgi:hypothetical protein
LDDYEEGTWTPTLYGESGSIGTYAQSDFFSNYTKVGRIVHLYGSVLITDKGSWSGAVLVDLPIVPTAILGTGAVRSQLHTFDGTLVFEYSSAGSAARFNVTKTGVGQTNLQWSDLVVNGVLGFSLTYFTS